MKNKSKASLLIFGSLMLLSSTGYAGNIIDDGNVKCRKINNDDIRKECREKKFDNDDNDVIKNGRARCRKIENDRLRKECFEQKFD